MKLIESMNEMINNIVWGPPMLVLMGITGVLMTILTGCM